MRVVLGAVDLMLAGLVAVVTGCILRMRHLRRRRPPAAVGRRLMAIDSMYDLSTLRARRAEHIVTHRDLEGYFSHVWSVHPFAGIVPGAPAITAFGSPTITPLTQTHTMIEGRPGRFRRLARLPYANFVLAQAQLTLLLDRLVDDEGVGVIRGDPYYHGLLALLLGALNGRPVELRVLADYDAHYETSRVLAFPRIFKWRFVERRVARFTLTHADAIVVQSTYTRAFALRNGAPAEHVEIGPMGIFVDPVHLAEPAERGALEDEFGLGDRPVIAYVGRLADVKHPDDVIISVAKARAHDPRIAGLMVGEGIMRDELRVLCAELGVQEDVVFAGERDQTWIARMLPRCTAIAAPISGLSLVEAALSATVIVAYDTEWHSEFLEDDRQAILVAYRDTDAMAAAFQAVVADPERAKRLGRAARARALERMDPGALIAHERRIAERLIARRSHD